MKKILQFVVVASIAATANMAFGANPQYTSLSTIVTLDSGWGADTVSIKLLNDSTTGVYPAGCLSPQAGYVTSTTDPGRKLYQEQLQEAFWRNYKIRLLISGTAGDCPFGKPRIISVSMCRPSPLGQC
jgi:hypothetical protein